MSTEYTSFLAARVLNDNKLLSIKARYLAAFHESENRKRKGSCHATYIVTGIPKPLVPAVPKTDQDHDTIMQSSPFPEPTQATQPDDEEAVKVSSVVLVAEEQLEEVKESMLEVTSIHIYSIEPSPLKRREGAPPPPPPPQSTKSSAYVVPVKKEPVAQSSTAPSATPAPTAKDTKRDPRKDFFGSAKTKKEETPKQTQTSEPASSSKSKVPLKRGQSDLMSSFSNAQPKKAKKPEKEETPPPDSRSEANKHLDFMDVDDEPDDEPEDEEAKAAEAAKQEALRKKREQEEEELRQMMEDDDDEEPEPSIPKQTAQSTSPEATATSPPAESEPTPPTSTSAPGRRKVKRKVTKKVRTKDEDGYIVTREVTEWEEFSEDDVPAPLKPAAKPAAKPNAFAAMKQAAGSQKGKKGDGGGGKKVDIASFFSKK
ncbi:hypothetical protein ABW19_dt0203225 [Dactylella cylindrospora]|nr:hypothetical protein ABW19_dt0203225 [Dactylella cylindrospora]